MGSRNRKVEPVWNDYQASGFGIVIQNKNSGNSDQDQDFCII